MADRLLDAVIMLEELLHIGHRERCLGRQVAVWIGGVASAEALPLPMAEPGADGGQRRVASQREPRGANPRGIDLRPERRISQQLVDEDGDVARRFRGKAPRAETSTGSMPGARLAHSSPL